ncbi:flagellar biosynthesis anti-sigma factor FlgM [Planococcus shixiaomingii]|uniref:flagellar biosynthesis anti-sigma factor FlgM n=1 Tax=Planococcus shixiaomingii TaxID=3058393 RepID=UPI002612936D|nr:flagellar biosynthesis anti-sigma factor FlgM [Planococcus sp. N022]WKA53923.1 flagellar biosynthesis anti-sigma factor FlgM [Planococcus sp. N022]
MNIDKTTGSSFIQSYQKQLQATQAAKNKPVQKEDQVQISSQAKEMFVKTNEVDAARQEKINLLKAQIESGDYVNNSEKVADKVFQFWFGK